MDNKLQTKQPTIKGYLYIVIDSINIPSAKLDVSCHLSLGLVAKCSTKPKPTGTKISEVFLIEVPTQPVRLVMEFNEEDQFVGDCRYDITPFFGHPGSSHTIASDILNNNGQIKGNTNIKITFFSAQFGKLRIRVFHLSLTQPYIDRFKKAHLKVKIGVYSQSSPEWQLDKQFDHTVEMVVLLNTANLDFQVVNEQGTLAKYTIYDLQKSGLLINQSKAYQVSLFNYQKAVGTIKYQVDWIN